VNRPDLVYINKFGANEELRYSLRSVKNLSYNSVWVVGGKPSWYIGNYISVPPVGGKLKNARANLEAIIENNNISSDFILMNDDFYILRAVGKVEPYHQGLLINKVNTYESAYPRSNYTRLLRKTYNSLVDSGIQQPLSYDLHIPILYNKEKLAEAMSKRLLWRSTYGNLFNIGGTQMNDVKVYIDIRTKELKYDYLNSKYPFLSTEDKSFPIVRDNLLLNLFPNKSEFERTYIG
jgi:hypothetical protein